MAVIKNMMVRAGADFSAFTTQAKKASSAMRGMQSNVSNSCSIMKRSLSGISKSCGTIKTALSGVKSALGALGAVVSVAAVVAATKSAVEAYDKQAEAEIKLATIMRNTMGARNAEIQSVLDLCSAQQKLGVVGDENQIAGAQELAKYLKLSSSLERLLPVMNDMAAQQHGFNVTAENCTSIATVLGKAMSGQTTVLRRYGFTLTSAQEALLKTGNEEERAALLASIVSQRVGGMNRVLAQTPSGRMQQLSNAIGDVKEQFGEAARTVGVLFLPVLWRVADILAVVAGWATRAASAIASVFGASSPLTGWQNIGAGVGNLGADFSDLGDSVSGAGAAASEAKRKMLGFDELNVLGSSKSGGGGGGSSGVGGVGGASTFSEEASVGTGVSAFVSQLKYAVRSGDWEGLGRLLGNKVNEVFSKVDLTRIGKKLGKKLDGVIRTAFSFLKTVDFKEIAGRIAGFFNGVFSEIDFGSAGRLLVRRFTSVFDFIIGFINGLDWGEVCGSVLQFDFYQAFAENQRMNASNTTSGGYGASEMYATTLPALVEALPSWLKTRLKTFSVVATKGGGSSDLETITGNKLALRSVFEVFANPNTTYFSVREGTQNTFYGNSPATYGNSNVSGTRGKNAPGSSSSLNWNTRSPAVGYSNYYGFINGGTSSSVAPPTSTSYALAPFGCL